MYSLQSQSLNLDTLHFDQSKFQKQSLSTNFFINQNNDQNNANNKDQTQYKFIEEQQQHINLIIPHQIQSHIAIQSELDQLCQRFDKLKNIFIKHSERELTIHESRLHLKCMEVDQGHVQPDVKHKILILQSIEEYVQQIESSRYSDYQHAKIILENKFQEYYLERHYGCMKSSIPKLIIDEKDQPYINQKDQVIEYFDSDDCKQDSLIELQNEGSYQQERKMLDENTKSCNKQNTSNLQLFSSKSTLENQTIKKQNTIQTIQNNNHNHRHLRNMHNILIDQSQEQYQNQFSRSFNQFQIIYDTPSFIQVQIPIVIYRTKEIYIDQQQDKMIQRQKDRQSQESNKGDLSELDAIINKFTMPYEEIYQNAQLKPEFNQQFKHTLTKRNDSSLSRQISRQDDGNLTINNQIGSIMLNSRVQQPKESSQMNSSLSLLDYYEFKNDQQDYKLQLDSYMKMDNFMINLEDSHLAAEELERSPTQRSIKYSSKIQITQKIDDKQQLLEKYQQSQRFLLTQNTQLHQKIEHYKAKLQIQQHKTRQFQQLAKQLTSKLQEELQYVKQLTQKIQNFNIQKYEQKIIQLTNQINLKQQKQQQFENKINQFQQELKNQKMKEAKLKNQINMVKAELLLKQQQLQQIIKICQEKQQELKYYQEQQINFLEKINSKKQQLLSQISNKQQQNFTLKQKIKEYQNLILEEGILMKFQDLQQIKQNLQQKQNYFNQQKQIFSQILENKSKQYSNIINQFQKQLENEQKYSYNLANQIQILKQQNKFLKEQNCTNNKALNQKIQQLCRIIIKMKKQKEEYGDEFQKIFKQYDEELMQRNEEIYRAKKIYEQQLKNYKQIIQQQPQKPHQIPTQHTNYKQLYEIISKDYQKLKDQKLSQLTQKQKHIEYILNELSKYKKLNSRLKRYTKTLQQDLVCVNGIDKCSYHDLLIKHLMEEKEYYMQLLIGGSRDQQIAEKSLL